MQELGTLCFTCAPLTFNVLPVKEHPLRNYLLSETSKASIFKLFGMRKKNTLNILILGLHTVHWVANSVTYLVCKLFISAGEALPDIPVLLPLDHTWSPNSFSQKIWIYVLRTGSMGHLSKSTTTISKISSNYGKIGLKKMLGGVVLPPRTLFSPGVSFSQWTSQ